jgi:hypothetical protein
VDDTSNGWVGNCASPQNPGDICLDNLTTTSYSFAPTPGHSFTWWVHAIDACGQWSDPTYDDFICIPLPTCTANLSPDSLTIVQGEPGGTVVVNPNAQNGTIDRIEFSFSPVGYASTDTTPCTAACSKTVSGDNVGNTDLKATVYLKDITSYADATSDCDETTSITVTPPGPWFQTKGGDVHAQGEFSSQIPGILPEVDRLFSLALDSYPGVVSYLTGDADFGQGTTSWLANSPFITGKSGYTYFYHKLDSPAVDNFSCEPACPAPPSGVTTIYYSADNVTIAANNPWAIPANTKVVVLVNGDLTITLNQNKRVTVPVGSFLAFIVKRNINLDGNVGVKQAGNITPILQGMYSADGVFNTYASDLQGMGNGFRFVGAGLVYAKGGFNLGRDLKDDCTGICNATTPSELFIFRPDLVINTPKELWYSKISWVEVAP